MSFGLLREFEELFSHRWHAHAVLCLAAATGPLRFNQLAAMMNRRADERLPDATLTRCLHRLIGEKLVQATVADGGYNLYTLTSYGDKRAGRIGEIIRTLGQYDWTNGTEIPQPPA